MSRYRTPAAFKAALETRLKTLANSEGRPVNRIRQLFLLNRFLARLTHAFEGALLLKGGLALEFRLRRARSTKDIDLRLRGNPSQTLVRLQQAVTKDFGDFLSFVVQRDQAHPTIANEGVKYEGERYRIETLLANKRYGIPFGVDIAYGDPLVGKVEEKVAENFLDFLGISPLKCLIYPVETHLAEKLHAYTLPRKRTNSRVKDLPDIALLAKTSPVEGALLQQALVKTFSFRNTHPCPSELPAPPLLWEALYQKLAKENQLPWKTLSEVFAAAHSFLDPVLGVKTSLTWSPRTWKWS